MKKIYILVLLMVCACVATYGQVVGNAPDTYSSQPEAVGSVGGVFDVSAMGAATYTIPIKVPQGAGGLQPALSIVYSSQAGNGIAGWGCSIAGISAITRAPKNVYHDGTAKGVTHLADDAYLLDGQRLILVSGAAGQNGATYSPESDPFTTVTVHGTCNATTADMWFEVQSSNGITYRYGSTASGRQSYTLGSSPRIHAWYLDYVEDPQGNYMTYSYYNGNGYMYPTEIRYGGNKNANVTSAAWIVSFSYEARNDVTPFVIEGAMQCSLSRRLKSVVSTPTGSSKVYRRYTLKYNDTGDGSAVKYSRLTTVTEENEAGEKLNPTKLGWSFLTSFEQMVTQPTVEAVTYPAISFSDQRFIASDMNGDGLTDIVGVGTTTIQSTPYPYAIINKASLDESGNVLYKRVDAAVYSLPQEVTWDDWVEVNSGMSAVDLDGDGMNELMVPHYSANDLWAVMYFHFYSNTLNGGSIGCNLLAGSEIPSYATGDFNNDGKAEIIYIEKGCNAGNMYPGEIVGLASSPSLHRTSLSLNLSSRPEHIFVADFNGNGMNDLMVFYSGGYTIFWNQGNGISGVTFSDDSKTVGSNIGYAIMTRQGDFNGDGLPDFITNKTDNTTWFFALNNGDGTFTEQLAYTFPVHIHDQGTGMDDDKFSCQVFDFDMDGKSDVVITKSTYRKYGLFNKWEFDKIHTYWMRSNGTSLDEVAHATSDREEDALASRYLPGDFNGDGQVELMNYGYDCYNGVDANSDPVWRIYKNDFHSVYRGKVHTITDGYNTSIYLEYAMLTNKSIYTKGVGATYPVVDCTPPLPVVKAVTMDNGVTVAMYTTYQYNGLKAHVQGKGLLGMTSITANNTSMGVATEVGTSAWDNTFYVPTKTYTKTTLNNKTSETILELYVNDKGNKKYFAYPSIRKEKDLDGNMLTATYRYNTVLGKLEQEWVDYGEGSYKVEEYSRYILAGKVWKPQLISHTQKHVDDANSFEQRTAITYSLTSGKPMQRIENEGTALALTTDYTYDTVGNMLTAKVSGSGVEPLTHHYEYDNIERFIKKIYTTPVSTVNTFTYDTWGNVLTEKDEVAPNSILTTTYAYDAWGNRTATTLPDGRKTTRLSGWSPGNHKRFYTLVQSTGQPWVKTWYDSRGREVLVETLGTFGMPVEHKTSYDTKGRVKQKTVGGAGLTATENYTYDGQGRLATWSSSSGKSTSYSYGNRAVTATTDGKSYTKTYDAWGAIKFAADPLSSVSYAYSSTGKPKAVVAGGATTSMTYDDVGNQKTLTDPDAGTTTYTYDAAGRTVTQLNARNLLDSMRYDHLGRVTRHRTAEAVYTYAYNAHGLERVKRNGVTEYAYRYDRYGRLTGEDTHIEGSVYPYTYYYNAQGQLSGKAFPNYYTQRYDYTNGRLTSIGSTTLMWGQFLGGSTLWQLTDENAFGQPLQYAWGNGQQAALAYDAHQLLQAKSAGGQLPAQSYSFTPSTGNLASRNLGVATENFSYDHLHRLTQWAAGSYADYAPNGNITDKGDVGSYQYHSQRPHAVAGVTDIWDWGSLRPTARQRIAYDSKNRPTHIAQGADSLVFGYDHTGQRLYAKHYNKGALYKTTHYVGEYEKDIYAARAVSRCFVHAPTGLLAVREEAYAIARGEGSGKTTMLYTHTDHLGSIVGLSDANGGKLAEYSYDPWGRLRDPQTLELYAHGKAPKLRLGRGFTGHEHLPEFGLINMNARLYDPVLGRFLSPDPYVQLPDFSQSFNRYSYALNNPLLYTDPSGELFGISFTKFGYELDKFLFPFAIKINLHWGSDVKGIGYDVSWGIPKMIPVSYRQHKGETHYTKYYDNSFGGTERREGAEWTLGLLFNFSGTKFSSGETSQTTNKITIGTDIGFHISYENDYLFNMGMPGVPKADGGDRWRTAAVEIGGTILKVNLNMFTGDPGLKQKDRIYEMIDGHLTYTGGTADKYRAGVLSLNIGPLRIGRNSEQIRKVFQNQFAHDMLTGGEAKWFRVLDRKPRWYWYFGTGTGNTLW